MILFEDWQQCEAKTYVKKGKAIFSNYVVDFKKLLLKKKKKF